MSAPRFLCGKASLFALPFAVSFERGDEFGCGYLALMVGPFFIAVEWVSP